MAAVTGKLTFGKSRFEKLSKMLILSIDLLFWRVAIATRMNLGDGDLVRLVALTDLYTASQMAISAKLGLSRNCWLNMCRLTGWWFLGSVHKVG